MTEETRTPAKKENGEYELAGLDEYEEFMRIRAEGQEDAS